MNSLYRPTARHKYLCRSCRRLRSLDVDHKKDRSLRQLLQGTDRHKKAARKRLFGSKMKAYFRPDIFWMAPLSSASEQSAQVPLGGIELIPVMALARMPSRPPW